MLINLRELTFLNNQHLGSEKKGLNKEDKITYNTVVNKLEILKTKGFANLRDCNLLKNVFH